VKKYIATIKNIQTKLHDLNFAKNLMPDVSDVVESIDEEMEMNEEFLVETDYLNEDESFFNESSNAKDDHLDETLPEEIVDSVEIEHAFVDPATAQVVEFEPPKKATSKREFKRKGKGKHPFCPYCLKMYQSVQTLDVHIQKMHADELEPKISCTEPNCEEVFFTYNKMNIHIRDAHRSERIACKQCSILVHPVDMKLHIRRNHSKETKFSCDKCGFTCKFIGMMRSHIETHRPAEER
jgi:RNase P subunit RPR2